MKTADRSDKGKDCNSTGYQRVVRVRFTSEILDRSWRQMKEKEEGRREARDRAIALGLRPSDYKPVYRIV